MLTMALVGLTASCDPCDWITDNLGGGPNDRERCTVRGVVEILNDALRAGLQVEASTDFESVRTTTDEAGAFTFPRPILCEGMARLVDLPEDLWFPSSSEPFSFARPPYFEGYAGATVTGSTTWNGSPPQCSLVS